MMIGEIEISHKYYWNTNNSVIVVLYILGLGIFEPIFPENGVRRDGS